MVGTLDGENHWIPSHGKTKEVRRHEGEVERWRNLNDSADKECTEGRDMINWVISSQLSRHGRELDKVSRQCAQPMQGSREKVCSDNT